MRDTIYNNIEQFSTEEFSMLKNKSVDNGDPLDSDEVAWKEATSVNTEDAYIKYITTQRNGKYLDEARRRLRFLQKSPSSPDVEPVQESIDDNQKEEYKDSKITVDSDDNSRNTGTAHSDNHTNSLGQQYLHQNYTLDDFIQDFNNPHLDDEEKIKLLRYLGDNRLHESREKIAELLMKIINDRNLFSAHDINLMINEGLFTYNVLTQMGLDGDVVRALANDSNYTKFAPANPKIKVDYNRNSTEIFFWGIPGTGKTCALGAILSVLGDANDLIESLVLQSCPGKEYLEHLPECFNTRGGVTVLPHSTTGTYEMAFDIIDKKKGRKHKITLIDFAGEILRMIRDVNNGVELTKEEQIDFDKAMNLLKGNDYDGTPSEIRQKNRKMHFFIIECGSVNKIYNGSTQTTYLNETFAYVEKTGVFKKNTDAIYLVVTKADKLDRTKYRDVEDYVNKEYSIFCGNLQVICRGNRIGNGYRILPFSLGEVYFQKYCKLNVTDATEIAKIIVERSCPEQSWFAGIFSK